MNKHLERLKGRFRVLVKNNLKDADFASKVALVCCALHNQFERCASTFEPSWLGDIDVAPHGICGIAACGNRGGRSCRFEIVKMKSLSLLELESELLEPYYVVKTKYEKMKSEKEKRAWILTWLMKNTAAKGLTLDDAIVKTK